MQLEKAVQNTPKLPGKTKENGMEKEQKFPLTTAQRSLVFPSPSGRHYAVRFSRSGIFNLVVYQTELSQELPRPILARAQAAQRLH
jgi:hypothetical protein